MAYMYILQCCDGSFYTGSTIDLETRLIQHENGDGSVYTKRHLPIKLVYYEEFDRVEDSYLRERQIHGWNREKKRALIEENYLELVKHSMNSKLKVKNSD